MLSRFIINGAPDKDTTNNSGNRYTIAVISYIIHTYLIGNK